MRFSLVPFEERILLDAAGAANVVNAYDAEHSADQAQDQAQAQQQHADNPGAVTGNNDAVDGRVLVISSQIHDSALLADAAKDGVTVITYDFNTSLADLAQTIADKTAGKEVNSIGFALMGADGKFAVTSDAIISLSSLSENTDQIEFFKEVGSLVKNGGSIDILACNVAANTEGLQLIQQIDNLVDSTNRSISVNASSDLTGNASVGGDWDLEVGSVNALDRYFDADKVVQWDSALDNTAPYFTGVFSSADHVKVGNNLNYYALENTTYSFRIAAADREGDRIGYIVKGFNGFLGTIEYAGRPGQYYYTAPDGFVGTESIRVTIYDTSSFSTSLTIYFHVLPVNDAPVAQSASATTPEDTPLSGSVTATDVDSATLTYSLVSGPSQGTLIFNNDGTYTYTPGANYNGTDSFTYRASDGSLFSNNAVVNLTITPVNDAPVATAGSVTTPENTPISTSVIATDVDSATLTYSLVSGPSQGTLIFNNDGTYTYTPGANYNGTDSFTYRASDGSLFSNDAVVNLTITPVNDAPTGGTNHDYATMEDTTLVVNQAAGVLAGVSDPEGHSINAVLIGGTSKGILTLNSDGSFTYVPNLNANGTDTFTFQIQDSEGALSQVYTSVIEITPVNDAPIASNPTLGVAEDGALNIQPDQLGTDVEGDSLTITVVTPPEHGTLTQNPDGTVTYTPNADYNGPDSFSYTVNDGSADSQLGVVNLIVTPVNDAPIASNPTLGVAEDGALNIQPDQLGTDVEGDSLTITVVTPPEHGTLTQNPDGTVTYTPNADYNGPDSFSYTVNDGSADSQQGVVNLIVTPVNDAPIASNPILGVAEDGALNIQPDQLGTDVEGDSLTITVVTLPEHGTLTQNPDGTVTYTPDADYNGPDSFSYTVNDGSADSQLGVVNLIITPVNDAPIASNPTLGVAEDGALNIQPDQLGTDVEGDSLTITVVTLPEHGTLTQNPDGTVTYIPNADYNGPDSFSYTVNDGSSDSQLGVVNLIVTPVNDAPIASNPILGVAEDGALNIQPDQLGTDVEGDSLTITVVTLPEHGTLTQNPDGTVTYTPDADYNGPDSFSYTVNDGSADSQLGVVNLIVTPVNDAPIASNPTLGVAEDGALNIQPDQLGTDVEGDPLTITIVTPPEHGTLTQNPDGTVTYTPNADYNGPDSFSYTVNDGSADSQLGVVNLIVTPSDYNPDLTGNYVPPSTDPTYGEQPTGGIFDLDPIAFDNSPNDEGFNNHTYRFLTADIVNKGLNLIEDLKFDNEPKYQEDDSAGLRGVRIVGDGVAGGTELDIKPIGGGDFSNPGDRWFYENDDLSKLLFFLGPVVDKIEYTNKKHLKNLQKNKAANLFLYRERKKVKKLSDLIKMLALLDLSFKRKSKTAIKKESMKTEQRRSLEKNLNTDEYGEEYLSKYVKELEILSNINVDPDEFPLLEALAVEVLTKYIIAQDLKEGFSFRFPIFPSQKNHAAAEYHLEKILPLGSSEIPVYLFTGKGVSPIIAFRGTKLGFKKIAEVQSVIENLNSEGPARAHYNDFAPVLKTFFSTWFEKNQKSKKFRIFGYSQGGVLGQRAVVEFAPYIQTDEKEPSIFFNSPGVEGVFFNAWNNQEAKDRPAVVNYVTTGDIVSKTGVGFIGNIIEISPEKQQDLLDSHFGVKFLEKDWKLYTIDPEGEAQSKTRAILNAIQASFLTNEVYKLASTGVELLFANYEHKFIASKGIKTFETNVVMSTGSPPPAPQYNSSLQNSLIGRDAAMNTHVLTGHVSYIPVNDSSLNSTKDSMVSNDLKMHLGHKTQKSMKKLFEMVTKSEVNLNKAPELTSFEYKRDEIIQKPKINRTSKPLDLTFEPDLYSQKDMAVAALAVMEDIREYLPETDQSTENAVLDAVQEEKNIDHLNR